MTSRVQGIRAGLFPFQPPPPAEGGVISLRNARGATNTGQVNGVEARGETSATGSTGAVTAAGTAAAGVTTGAAAGGVGTGAGTAAAAASARDPRSSNFNSSVPPRLPPPPLPLPLPLPRVGIRGNSARRMTTNTRMYPVGPRPQGNDFLLFSLGFAAVVSAWIGMISCV